MVHQAGLADTAIPEDDNLASKGISGQELKDKDVDKHLEQNLLLGGHFDKISVMTRRCSALDSCLYLAAVGCGGFTADLTVELRENSWRTVSRADFSFSRGAKRVVGAGWMAGVARVLGCYAARPELGGR